MRTMMRSPLITIGLATLCSWLGWMAFEEAGRPVPPPQSAAIALEADRTTAQNPEPGRTRGGIGKIEFPPLDTFGEMVARPLFNASRRPIAVEKLAVDEKPAELNVMLSGIIIGESRQIAHLRSATDKQTHALSVGDKIDEWEIRSIFPDRVVLQSGGRIETLFMQKPGAGDTAGDANRRRSSRRAAPRSPRDTRRNLRRSPRRGGQ